MRRVYNQEFESVAGIYKISYTGDRTLYFSISEDGKIFSEWLEATHANLSKFARPENHKIYIVLGLQLESSEESESSEDIDIDIEIETVSMKGDTNECVVSKTKVSSGCGPGESSIFVDSEKLGIADAKPFSPYTATSAAAALTEQLNKAINEALGVTVKYFKTKPDTRTEDYILNEYSLRNVVDHKCVKIMIPNNALPSTDIQFNPLMMDYPTMFTVHILKKHFREIFGEKSHPDTGDYIYVDTIFHNMYEINSVIDDTRYEEVSSYWIVSLKQFEKRAERIYKDDEEGKELLDDTMMVISGTGDFYEESLEDKAHDSMEKAAHTMQEKVSYNDGNGYDQLRTHIDSKVKITEDILKNRMTVISENQYDMSGAKEMIAVTYNEQVDMSSKDNQRTLSFIFSMNTAKNCSLFRADSEEGYMSISVKDYTLTADINGTSYKYQNVSSDTLYGIVYMYNNGISVMHLYEFTPVGVMNYAEKKVSEISKNIKRFSLKNSTISLCGFDGFITNLRILGKTLSEENITLLLTQTLIKDSHLLLLADNARKRLNATSVY
jgi:hypothetical protein